MNKIYILLSAVLFCASSHIMQAQNMNYVDYIFHTETQNLINPAAVGGEKGILLCSIYAINGCSPMTLMPLRCRA